MTTKRVSRCARLGCAVGLALLASTQRSLAQDDTTPAPAIEDNSFFIEEAYNQEEGLIQHISAFTRFGGLLGTSDYSFTEEWPLGGQAHQLSVTLPYSWGGAGGITGFGDTLLNYRHQLFGRDNWAVVAPRLSLVLPTGTWEERKPGLQVNLPASKRLNSWLVVHANAGATFLPAAETQAYNIGGSIVGLVTRNLNVMLEVVSTYTIEQAESGRRSREWETIVSPGVRFALNLGALQIVPGLAVPFRHGGGQTSTGLFAYLSFEHPLKSRPGTGQTDGERPAGAQP